MLIDSLGNARDEASLPTLVSHMTDGESTATKLNVKHAAVRAVGQYVSEEVRLCLWPKHGVSIRLWEFILRV